VIIIHKAVKRFGVGIRFTEHDDIPV
jgi:hypothetical protein